VRGKPDIETVQLSRRSRTPPVFDFLETCCGHVIQVEVKTVRYGRDVLENVTKLLTNMQLARL
jgi:hypothetical protein